MKSSQSKKILYVITKSNYGGAQKYVYELAVEAKSRGFDVAVAAGGTGGRKAEHGKLAELLTASAIRFVPVTNFMRNMSFWTDVKAFFEIIKIVWVEKPDILHVTSSKAGGIGAFVGRLLGIKNIVFTSHGLTMDETWRPLWQRILITWSTWFTILLSHHTIMISTETYEQVKKLPLLSRRVSLVFNGIRSSEILDTSLVRKKLLSKIPSDAVVIGGIGELHQNKNWSSLIRSLPSLTHNVHVAIIGEGEERAVLENMAEELHVSDRVHLLGFISEAQTHIKLWDIFILPSKKEGLPYVLLEAGLASLPVVASDLPGNRDIISHEETGLLIKPEPERISNTVAQLFNNRSLSKQYGETLYKTVSEKFSVEKMFKETFAKY